MCRADRLLWGDDSEGDTVLATHLPLVSTGKLSLIVLVVLSQFPPPPSRKEREM